MGICSSKEDFVASPKIPKGQSAELYSDEKVAVADGYAVLVNVTQARNVAKMDWLSESDPYVKVRIGDQEKRTSTVQNNKNPVWNESFRFDFKKKPTTIELKCMDKDKIKDDHIGTHHYRLPPAAFEPDAKVDFQWVTLKKDDKDMGELQIRVHCFKLTDAINKSLAFYNFTHVLEVKIAEGHDLKSADIASGNENYVVVGWGNKSFRSNIQGGSNPVWDQTVFFWANEQSQATWKVALTVYDHDKVTKDDVVGTGYVDAQTLLAEENTYVEAAVQLGDAPKVDTTIHRLSNVGSPTAMKSKSYTNKSGCVIVTARMIPKDIMFARFWDTLLAEFDLDKEGTLGRSEILAMLQALQIELTAEDFEKFWVMSDVDNSGKIEKAEARLLIRALMFINFEVANKAALFVTGGLDAVNQSLMTGVTEAGGAGDIKVMDRESGVIVRENIPGYVKVALKSLFSSKTSRYVSTSKTAVRIMEKLTIRQGRKYDDPKSVDAIDGFVKLHSLDWNQVKGTKDDFKNFNQFFYRELKPSARPLFEPDDPTKAVCPADCRMMVFENIAAATDLWIKGSEFTVERVLGPAADRLAPLVENGSMVIARLAPQDYHRWHFPVGGRTSTRTPIPGAYYTVNPIAVNSPVNVYTENKREVCELESKEFGKVVMVAVGATMVGSINILAKDDSEVKKGDQHGYFAFGGSTVLIFFEPNRIVFDPDILANSKKKLETLVKVNSSLGRTI